MNHMSNQAKATVTATAITIAKNPPVTAPVTAPEDFISKKEVARRLDKTVRTVENWMERGILPYYKLGRTVSFRWSEIEAHLMAKYRVVSRRGA